MITLDIDSTHIRLMEVNDRKVTKWATGPLEAGIFQDEIISDFQALGRAVKQMLAANGIKEKKVTASVSSLYSLSRVVTVSTPLGQPITEEAALATAEEVIPLSMEDIYLSWYPIAPGEGGQQAMLVGIPKEVIDGEIRALKMGGINPHILELKTLAIARAVNREQALIINVDSNSLDVIIIVDGIAEVLHTTAWRSADLSEETQAERLISALDMTIRFYNSHRPADSPLEPTTPLFITGNLSGDPSLIERIQAETIYPIKPMAPPLDYPEHLPVSQYAVNIGLALKNITKPSLEIGLFRKNKSPTSGTESTNHSIPDINLLPEIYKPWHPSTRQISITLSVVAALGLLIPMNRLTSTAMKETAIVKQKYTAVNMLLDRRKLELANREPLQKAISEFDSIVALGGGFVNDLMAIKNMARDMNVKVSAIIHSGNSITFSCEAPDYATFRNFIKALEQNGRFTISAIPPEGYPYIKGGPIKLTPKAPAAQ